MKNWIKFFVVFLVIVAVVLTAIITISAYFPYYNVEKTAKKEALNEKLVSTVSETYVYSGKKMYVTVIGKDSDGQNKAVFVNEDDTKAKKETVLLKDGISQKEAVALATKGQDVKKVMHVRLGIEKPGVVWEVTFKNNANQLNYVYILFDSGKWWKKITNL